MEEEQQENQLTPEQLAKFEEFKKQRQQHFEKEIPNLKVQRDYEQLLTEIDELYLRRVIVQMKVAQINAPSNEEKEEEPKHKSKDKPDPQQEEPKERKLKTT